MRNPLVVGDRVYLRAVEASDAEHFARTAHAETETFMDRWRFLFSPLSLEHFYKEMYKAKVPENIALAVCLKETDEIIGDVGLYDIDYVNGTAETGSWMHTAAHRGQGYGTEAKFLLLEYAFDRLQLHALRSYVWEPNTRSAAALLKQGYRPAGRLKWEEIRDGVHRDALIFDVLRDEWLAAREAWRAAALTPRTS
jgi:RimJ/RimL family protein N-acetyltransferase